MRSRGSPYPIEPRTRVIAALEAGMLDEVAAEVFEVGTATIYRWRRLKRETGSVAPRPRNRGGRKRALDLEGDALVRQLVEERPDRTIAEIGDLVRQAGYSASDSSVSRSLARLGLTFKKSRSRQPSETGLT